MAQEMLIFSKRKRRETLILLCVGQPRLLCWVKNVGAAGQSGSATKFKRSPEFLIQLNLPKVKDYEKKN